MVLPSPPFKLFNTYKPQGREESRGTPKAMCPAHPLEELEEELAFYERERRVIGFFGSKKRKQKCVCVISYFLSRCMRPEGPRQWRAFPAILGSGSARSGRWEDEEKGSEEFYIG